MGKSSFKFDWHRELIREPLPDKAKLVALALWDYTNANGKNAHPGYQALAEVLHVSISTVKRQLKELRELGWIRKTRQSNAAGARDFADVYELSLPADRGSQPWPTVEENRGSQLRPSVEHSVDAWHYDDRGSNDTDRGSNTGDRGSELWTTNRSFTTSSLHHSDSDESGRKQASAATDFDAEDEAFETTVGFIEERVHGFKEFEESTVRGMLASGSHHIAIINKLEYDRTCPF